MRCSFAAAASINSRISSVTRNVTMDVLSGFFMESITHMFAYVSQQKIIDRCGLPCDDLVVKTPGKNAMTFGRDEPLILWPEEEVRKLRRLWMTIDPNTGKPLSTQEIGRRMGKSKNAIVGKAHRLDLDARASPIRRPDAYPHTHQKKERPEKVDGRIKFTLPPPAILLDEPEPPPPPRPPPPPPVAIVTPKFRRDSADACAFPTGFSPRIRFECEALAEHGKPYCVEHSGLCFVKVGRKQREETHGT